MSRRMYTDGRSPCPGRLSAAVLPLLVVLVGCGPSTSLDPPVVHYGEDVCAHCNMIVNEERFAAASFVDAGDGSAAPLIFDDLSCLVEYESANPKSLVRRRYVHDAISGAWVDASRAHFVKSDAFRSPMGGGALALQSRVDADSVSSHHASEVLTFEGVRARWGKGD